MNNVFRLDECPLGRMVLPCMPTLTNAPTRVLLLEDDHEDRVILQRYLNRSLDRQFEVTWLRGLKDCIEHGDSANYDVVLLDYYLSDCTGLELIKELPYSIRRLPIVMFTRYGNVELDEQAMELGVEFFVDKKDLNERVLERTIRYAIRNKELQNRLMDFTAVVTHDLSGPLRSMGTSLDLLANGKESDLEAMGFERGELLTMAISESARLQRLVRELSRYAQATRVVVNWRDVDLNSLMSEILNLLAADIESRSATVELGELPSVRGDPDLLTHVLMNLLQNGLKFVEDKAPHIRIGVEIHDGRATLSFKDNGVGFPADKAERIFEPLFRLHNRTRFEGTGLGLAICREFIDRLDGRIWARSETNCGATFFVELPLAY